LSLAFLISAASADFNRVALTESLPPYFQQQVRFGAKLV
jgi:hypothetical protein